MDVPASRGKRIILLHAGSDQGWVPCGPLISAKNICDSSLDYHEDMTAELFETWFEKSLLPKLPSNSVIVMDNASYHSRQINKVPNSNSLKQDIANFLRENDMFFEESYRKDQLLEVLKTKTFPKQFYVDDLASKSGHTVLRLPPYYCVFNPIELIWSQLKKNIRRRNHSPNLDRVVIKLIQQEVTNISPELWKNCVSHVQNVEKSYINEGTFHKKVIINLDVEDDSESDGDYFDRLDELDNKL